MQENIPRSIVVSWFDAIFESNYGNLKMILKKYPDIINIRDDSNLTALDRLSYVSENEAKFKFYKVALELLLEQPNLDVNITDSRKIYNALINTIEHQNITFIKLLLNHPDIDVNFQKLNGTTALMVAVNGNYDIMKLLLEHPKINLLLKDCNHKNFIERKTEPSPIFYIYNIQKIILTKEPSLIKSFIIQGIELDPHIQQEFNHLIATSELNLL